MIIGLFIVAILCIISVWASYKLMKMCDYYQTQSEIFKEHIKELARNELNKTAAEQLNKTENDKVDSIFQDGVNFPIVSIKSSTKKLDNKIKKRNNESKK